MVQERLVQCLECGYLWQSSAETPRCPDPDDECGRVRKTRPVPDPSRVETLEDAGLSGREAEVVALKEHGFTHERIHELIDLPKSTVDEYSRRARTKVEQARALVDSAGGVYPDDS